jgi:hypothetical protein
MLSQLHWHDAIAAVPSTSPNMTIVKPTTTTTPALTNKYDACFCCREYKSYDFSGLTEKDEIWTFNRETRQHSIQRANEALQFLWARPEKTIAVVSHAGFMGMSLFSESNVAVGMSNGTSESNDGLEVPFENCEMRAIELTRDGRTFHLRLVSRVKRPQVEASEKDTESKMLAHHNMAQLYQFKGDEIERKLKSIRALNPGKVGNPHISSCL